MKLSILLCFSMFFVVIANAQKNSIQSRVIDQNPELYDTWSIDITESKIEAEDLILKEMKLSKDHSVLARVDSLIRRASFYDLDLLPLERSTITNYGTAQIKMLNSRMRKEQALDFYFLTSKFSANYSVYFFSKEADDPMIAALEFIDGKGVLLNMGINNFMFSPSNHHLLATPKLVNKNKTSWNEDGLKNRVRETFTKKYEISSGSLRRPYSLSIEKYDTEGLLEYSKYSQRDFFIEKTISGKFERRTIQEFRSYQNLTITTDLKITGNKVTGESIVEGKLANKVECEFLNGRLSKEKVINYLNEVEQEKECFYSSNGQLYSVKLNYIKQDISTLDIFKYLKYDDQGNWIERMIYRDSYVPKYLEVRELVYF